MVTLSARGAVHVEVLQTQPPCYFVPSLPAPAQQEGQLFQQAQVLVGRPQLNEASGGGKLI